MTVKDDKLVFNISARIVDTIIGDLFFRDDEVLATADSDGDNDDDMANTIVATLVSSLASHGALSSMCCVCGACRIKSTSSSSHQLKVSMAAPMSRTSIRSLFICGRNTT
jgi:hypothetical protein